LHVEDSPQTEAACSPFRVRKDRKTRSEMVMMEIVCLQQHCKKYS